MQCLCADMKVFRWPCLLRYCVFCVMVTAATLFTVNAVYRLTRGYNAFHWLDDAKATFHWMNDPRTDTAFHWMNYQRTVTGFHWVNDHNSSETPRVKKGMLSDYIVFTNDARSEKFRVRISLTSQEQINLANKMNGTDEADIYIPLKRKWTKQDRYTNEWTQLDLLSKESPVLLNVTKNPCWYDVHNVLRCLPYMYLIGAPKCGTTDLYERLLQHPDFTEPSQKEPHWISRQRLGRSITEDGIEGKHLKKKTKFADYLSSFTRLSLKLTGERVEYRESQTVNPRITGDCSASTLWDNDIWTQLPRNDNPLEPVYTNPHYVYKLNPKAKIIVLLRDPVSRLYSDYLYFLPGAFHKSQALFHNQVVNSIRLFTDCLRTYSLRSCVYNPQLNKFIPLRLRIGIYYIYLREWFEVFPSHQILVLQTEEYARAATRTIQHVYQFLGLEPLNEEYISSITRARKRNTRKVADESIGDMWPETRHLLKSFYSTFNQLLEKLIKDKAS